jgi:diguanylate cyclase (GGDEF)-like protein
MKKQISKIVNKLIRQINKYLSNILFNDQSFIVNKNEAKYWKNRIFYITSAIIITIGAPLMIYGTYLFITGGEMGYAVSEAIFYFVGAFILTNKKISIKFKKYFLTYALYFLSIFLLLTAGPMGAGMVFIVLSLILSGCLLENRQLLFFLIFNCVIFILLTLMLYGGQFEGTSMEPYKDVWFMNGIAAQSCGMMLLILINIIYIGLERQTQYIRKLNQYDSLTGLFNRSFYETQKKRLEEERKLPLSIIVGDINGLKIINDSLGHTEGDRLLIMMAKIIDKCCRKDDIAARMGGDEFNILLPGADRSEVTRIMKKINQECQKYNKNSSNDLYHISISLGAATRTSEKESLDEIQKTAEDFMYKRKLLEGRSIHSSIISSMKTALFEKSHETQQHAKRIINLTTAVGQVIGLTNQQFDELELFSTLHDIGKIGVDNQILNKPAKLTEEEWILMKKHSEIGYRIAMASPELMSIAYDILTHHERWDGKGYPQGLAGENIPLLSRILAVADAYDAMTEDRPYRKRMSKEAAIAEIERNAGTQFDPNIAQIFINTVKMEKDLD